MISILLPHCRSLQRFGLLGFLAVLTLGLQAFADEATTVRQADIVVFGATSAGITAAVAAGRAGDRVILIEPGYLPGGMMTGGLTKTDIGKEQTIGGLSREFYERVLAYYTKTYGKDSRQVRECTDGRFDVGYFFEPSVAGRIFNDMLSEAGVTTYTKERLDLVKVDNGRIAAIETVNYATGQRSRFEAQVFVDGTYEGDLMAQAGVLYRVGREARAEYGESLAGLTEGPAEYIGKGDHRVQAYNMRGTLTNRADIRVPIPKPEHYYPEVSASLVQAVIAHRYHTLAELFTDIPRWCGVNGKYDSNRADFIGANAAYAEADYEARARIVRRQQDYWLSYWWRLQNDPALPEDFKADARQWGLPADEYLESGHVSPQLYVRVARRMMGRYFLTQRDVQYDRYKPDTICMGSYNTDCHPIQRIWTADGLVQEGELNGSVDPYEIPYRSITPHGVKNLLVVAAVSASHVAYSSLRMEPVFMMIGHGGGVAADLAFKRKVAVQDVPVDVLQAKLKADGIPLTAPFRPVVDIQVVTPPPYAPGRPITFKLIERHVQSPLTSIAWNFDGTGTVQGTRAHVTHTFPVSSHARVSVIVKDAKRNTALPAVLELDIGENIAPEVTVHYSEARLTGRWDRVRGPEIEYRGRVGLSDGGKGDGKSTAVFSTELPKSGRYLVAMAFPASSNRAANVPVTITHDGGSDKLVIDQRKKGTPFAYKLLGEFRFKEGQTASVAIANDGARGLVVIDSVRWIWIGD